MKQMVAKKLGMSQVFDSDGNVIPVTVLLAEPMTVIQKKTKEKDRYEALQIGVRPAKDKHTNAPMRGHFKKNNVSSFRLLKEIVLDNYAEIKVGQELKVDEILKAGDFVDVRSRSKGKGFAGVMKRHNFGGGPASHGGMSHRRPASAGETESAKVYRGKRSPGHLGSAYITVQGLEVVRVEPERQMVLVRGAVPGAAGTMVFLSTSVKSVKKLHQKKTADLAKQEAAASAKDKAKDKAKPKK